MFAWLQLFHAIFFQKKKEKVSFNKKKRKDACKCRGMTKPNDGGGGIEGRNEEQNCRKEVDRQWISSYRITFWMEGFVNSLTTIHDVLIMIYFYMVLLQEETRDRIMKLLDWTKKAIHVGFIPLIIYIGKFFNARYLQ
jgi:hypothetical protein